MYYGRFLVEFKREGPYKWFKNPMYSIGQLPGYGMALAVGSLPELLLTFMNQVCYYLFYYIFEFAAYQASSFRNPYHSHYSAQLVA